jgi:hypothetical protein
MGAWAGEGVAGGIVSKAADSSNIVGREAAFFMIRIRALPTKSMPFEWTADSDRFWRRSHLTRI